MTTNNSQAISAARQLLDLFSCKDTRPVESESEKVQLRQALKLFIEESDHQNFGVCADSSVEGLSALVSYLEALGYQTPQDEIPQLEEPVYLKFNSKTKSYFQDTYTGEYRGVLFSCQSYENDDVSGTYGYLPLNLFS